MVAAPPAVEGPAVDHAVDWRTSALALNRLTGRCATLRTIDGLANAAEGWAGQMASAGKALPAGQRSSRQLLEDEIARMATEYVAA